MSDVDVQNKIQEFLSASFKKFMVHDYNEAIRDLKSAEVIDPENPEILYNLGINYCRMGLFKTAINYLQKLIKQKNAYIDALEVKKILAYCYVHMQEYAESIKYLDNVLDMVPADVVANSMKGYCLDMQGKQSDAIKVYESILKIDKVNYNAYNSIAYIIAKTGGDLKKAQTFATIAYESNRNNVAYLDTMGYINMLMGNYSLAEQYYKSAIEIAPLSDDIRNHFNELNRKKAR
jgi:tetratricopeptide (TPR) repeat protein